MSHHDSEENDKSLFKQALTGVTPLRPSKKQTSKPPRQQKSRPYSEKIMPKEASHTLSNPWDTSNIHAETCLSYGEHQLQHKQYRDLKRGKIPTEARLDLHGCRLEEAGKVLVQFITQAYHDNKRCVLVIHGKGGRFGEAPVLKNHVNHWLKQLPEVLAFHSAEARDGGCGALYVLLKRISV